VFERPGVLRRTPGSIEHSGREASRVGVQRSVVDDVRLRGAAVGTLELLLPEVPPYRGEHREVVAGELKRAISAHRRTFPRLCCDLVEGRHARLQVGVGTERSERAEETGADERGRPDPPRARGCRSHRRGSRVGHRGVHGVLEIEACIGNVAQSALRVLLEASAQETPDRRGHIGR
jgi:hypothetical protein